MIELFSGLAHVVVNKIFKAEEPDFVVKTHTAVTGVRGTDFGVRLQANSTTDSELFGRHPGSQHLPGSGRTGPQIHHIAFSFGPPGSPNSVILHNMQGTSVALGFPPTLPFTITSQDLKVFMNQLGGPLQSSQQGQGPGTAQVPAPSPSPTWGADSGLGTTLASFASNTTTIPPIAPLGLTTGTGSLDVTLLNTVTVPPTVVPTAVPITPGGGATPRAGADPKHLQLYPTILRRLVKMPPMPLIASPVCRLWLGPPHRGI